MSEKLAGGVLVVCDCGVVGFREGCEWLRTDLSTWAALVAGCVDDLGVVEAEGSELDEADVGAEILVIRLVVFIEGVCEHCCERCGVGLDYVWQG